MAEDKDERKIYEEKLQVILHTCLLYNSSQALGNHVNYVLHGKGNKGFKDKNKPLSQLKNIYNSLCAETSRNTNKEVDLDELLDNYKAVSECWTSPDKLHMRRTFSCNLYKPNEQHFQRNKILLFALLDYTFDKNEAIKKYTSIFCMNKYVIIAEKFEHYSKEIVLFNPLILLLMTGLLPNYDSKQTKADNIFDDYILLFDFLREYFQQSVAVRSLRDSFIEDINQRTYAIKSLRDTVNKSTDPLKIIGDFPLNRLFLIKITKSLFDLLKKYTQGENVFEYIRSRNNSSDPNIEGFWTNIEGGSTKSTNFWEIEGNSCLYLLTYYEKKPDNHGNYRLEYTKYICYVDQVHLFVFTLKGFEFTVRNNGKINHELMAFFVADFHSVDIGKGKSRIEKIIIDPGYRTIDWFPYREFYRVSEKDEGYKKMFKELPKVEKNPIDFEITEPDYIGRNFLFIPIDDSDLARMHASKRESHYLKVPKKLNITFQKVDTNSPFSIDTNSLFDMVTFIDGTVYILDETHTLSFEITTPEQRKELGIEFVDEVRDS